MGNKFSNTNGAQFSKGGLNFNNKFYDVSNQSTEGKIDYHWLH